ncbi:MAG: S8 family serine peptidase, partial [Bradyrhizobiaceae bacterium]|nr:S8 family serine peptidase [Bradyrhizobiaceae bacterium]
CSWGGTTPDPGGQDLMNYCLAKGALVVAASGNDGLFTDATPHFPSSFAGVLSVGASTSSNSPSYFSNYGYDVTTYAPGENILTTFQNNTYQSTNGTSFSSPFVAGICGLIKAKHPEWTPEMIIQQVRSTSDPMKGVAGSNRPKYFGCVNASKALRYNDSFSSGDKVPGIDMLSLSAGATGQITSYDPVDVDIVLKNHLGDATDVKLTIEPLGGAVEVTGNTNITVPTILHDATTTLNLTVKLKPTYPWYEADQKFMITVQSGSYLNYVLVRIPVKLPTSNSHVLETSNQYVSFDIADLSADGTIWVAGTYLATNAIFTGNKNGANGVLAAPFKPATICGVSGTKVMLGGLMGGKPTIALTTNAKDWSPIDVSTSMSSVAGIAMIDGQLGFAFGNPIGGKIGIAKTTDGGLTWAKIHNSLTANSGETVLPHVFHVNSKGVWFATSAKRIISTMNRGATWSSSIIPASSGSEIKSIAVDTLLNGAAVYKNGSNYYVALSEEGSVWKSDAVNSNALGIVPAAVASPGKNLVLVGSNGEVFGSDNAGKDWQVILSRSPMTVTRAVAKTSGSTTLVTTGLNVGLL